MKVEMVMPQMGESITEATISKWRKKAGEKVEKDEVILEISTDKVDSEIPAPASGVLAELLFGEGDVVPVKTAIALIDTASSGSSVAASSSLTSAAQVSQTPARLASAPSEHGAAQANQQQSNGSSAEARGDRFFSPLVMNLAQKHGLSLSELENIKGSGQGGRVNKQDLLAFIEQRKKAPPTGAQQPLTAATKPAAAPAQTKSIDWEADGSKVIPMDTMRQAIADHMVRSKHTSPHVYSVQEIDMSNVSKWRKKYKDQFQQQEGFNLSFTPFFLEAAVRALLKFPYVNCSLDGKKIVLKRHINLGCAVALGDAEKGFGLIVPVIKHAEEKNLVGLARTLNDLALRARSKKLLPDDVAGGTFTVTNPGVFGTMIGTPIINQPQVAILCLGAIVKRPVVIDDMIAIREMCFLTLSYDHRIIDGALGGSFLAFLREYLEGWDMERTLY